MNIDFTKQIIKLREKETLNKPFPVLTDDTIEGYALFTKTEEGKIVKMIFTEKESVSAYLYKLGYDWREEKGEFQNFDNYARLIQVWPELANAEEVSAADPQWNPDKVKEVKTKHESTRNMEDSPCAVELREVDHPIGYDDRTHAGEDKKKDKKKGKKLPPWLNKDKKDDKKEDKKGDKKKGKNGDSEEEKDKNGKKLPPWLKKKSKSKYSELYKKVTAEYGGPIEKGDNVKNINKECTHYKSEGVVKKINKIPGDKGVTIGYECTNAGKAWKEGDMLDKTPDQLEKVKKEKE